MSSNLLESQPQRQKVNYIRDANNLYVINTKSMGTRLAYYYIEQPTGKSLRDIIVENFTPFSAWYLNMCKDVFQEYNEVYNPQYLKECFERSLHQSTTFDQLDQRFIDQYTREFLIADDYLSEIGISLKMFGPCVNTGNYVESIALVENTGNEDFLALWTYLTSGRSLKNDAPFLEEDYEIRVGFLNRDEHKKLKYYLENYIGRDIQAIRDKYWTSEEKMIWQQGGSAGSSIASGAELVLKALNELNEKDVEVITLID